MAIAQFIVAIAQHHQRTHALDATGEELHQVERGRVGPVQVLEHDDGGSRRALQFGEECGEKFDAPSV